MITQQGMVGVSRMNLIKRIKKKIMVKYFVQTFQNRKTKVIN